MDHLQAPKINDIMSCIKTGFVLNGFFFRRCVVIFDQFFFSFRVSYTCDSCVSTIYNEKMRGSSRFCVGIRWKLSHYTWKLFFSIPSKSYKIPATQTNSIWILGSRKMENFCCYDSTYAAIIFLMLAQKGNFSCNLELAILCEFCLQ